MNGGRLAKAPNIVVKGVTRVLKKFVRIDPNSGEASRRPFYIETAHIKMVDHGGYEGSKKRYTTIIHLTDQNKVEVEGEATDIANYIRDDEVVVTCAYCGHIFEEGTPTSRRENLYAHIKVCTKHPLKAMQDRINELEAQQRSMGALINVVNHLKQNSGGHFAAVGKCTVCGVEDTPMINMVCEKCIKDAFDEWQKVSHEEAAP